MKTNYANVSVDLSEMPPICMIIQNESKTTTKLTIKDESKITMRMALNFKLKLFSIEFI